MNPLPPPLPHNLNYQRLAQAKKEGFRARSVQAYCNEKQSIECFVIQCHYHTRLFVFSSLITRKSKDLNEVSITNA